MIAQRRAALDIESARDVLDYCWLGDGAAVMEFEYEDILDEEVGE